MWEKKKPKEELKALLGKGAEFTGKMIFDGMVRIDGNFAGEIFGQGSLDIGQGAVVKADMDVHRVYIAGEVTGSITAQQKACIHSTGKLCGDVRTPVLIIEEGAFFDGRSFMSDVSQKGASAEKENKKAVNE